MEILNFDKQIIVWGCKPSHEKVFQDIRKMKIYPDRNGVGGLEYFIGGIVTWNKFTTWLIFGSSLDNNPELIKQKINQIRQKDCEIILLAPEKLFEDKGFTHYMDRMGVKVSYNDKLRLEDIMKLMPKPYKTVIRYKQPTQPPDPVPIYAPPPEPEPPKEEEPELIPLRDPLWKRIIRALIPTVESEMSTQTDQHTLKG